MPAYFILSCLFIHISEMNASSSVSSPDFISRDDAEDSDSDTEIPDYYQPISSAPDAAGGGDVSDDDGNPSGPLENGHTITPHTGSSSSSNGIVNGVMRMGSLDLSDEEEVQEKNDSEEEEEERRRAESDSAARRAFEQDESRRNAPLSADNAARVREAMRGVSFAGLAPRWAGDVSEDRLLDQLRQLRQPPPHSAA